MEDENQLINGIEESSILTLTLTPIELTYLAAQLGATTIGGIGDPFYGWLTEEVEEAWETAHSSLIEKGLIGEGEKGEVVMDYLVAGAVNTCAWPELTLFANTGIPGEPQEPRVFRLSRYFSIEQSSAGTGLSELSLTLFEGTNLIRARLWNSLAVRDGAKASGSIAMDMQQLWAAIKEGRGRLPDSVSVDVSDGEAGAALMQTIGSEPAVSNVVALQFRNWEWRTKGIGFISGGEYLWKFLPEIRGDASVWVVLSGCNLEEARSEMERVLDGMLRG